MTDTRITIEGHEDENLNGDITFHIPTLMENVRIDQRVAVLAAPIKFEDLPGDGRALVRLIATLEHVIDTAPRGWYRTKDGRPVLAFEHLSGVDEPLLWRVYAAWSEAVARFRNGRGGRIASDADRTNDPSSVESSESAGA